VIKKINTNTPTKTNKRIISLLSKIDGWGFGYDNNTNQINVSKPDAGFTLKTYNNSFKYINDDVLNYFAYLISDIVEKNILFKKSSNFQDLTVLVDLLIMKLQVKDDKGQMIKAFSPEDKFALRKKADADVVALVANKILSGTSFEEAEKK